jgi:hypothetical protein
LVDACDDFVMLKEIVAAGGGKALLDGVDEIGFVVQVAVNRILHDFERTSAGSAVSTVSQSRKRKAHLDVISASA